jgi:hypothetical protein
MVLGLGQSLTSIGQITAPALGGWLIGLGHLGSWAFVAAGAAGLGLVAQYWGAGRARAVAAVT